MSLIDSLWKSIGWEKIMRDPYMKSGILSSVLSQGEFFPAFGGAYMRGSFGSVVLAIPVRWKKNTEGVPADWSFLSGHCAGRNLERLTVCTPLPDREKESEEKEFCLLIRDEWGNKLPIYPFMADILPGFMPEQPLLMQVTAIPSAVEIMPPAMSADDLGDGVGYAEETDNQIHPSRTDSFMPGPKGSVYMQGWVTAVQERRTSIPDGAGGLSPLSVYRLVTVDTGHGIWNMPVSPAVMPAGTAQLRRGIRIRARVFLSGNPCVGQYQNGMIFSEQEYVNALRYALYTGHMNILSSLMNSSWEFRDLPKSGGVRSVHGLDSLRDLLHICGPINVVSCSCHDGRTHRALLVHRDSRAERNLIFISADDQQKICSVRAVSEYECPWEYESNIYHEE